MYSRIEFEVWRNSAIPESAFIVLLTGPAQYNGLQGQLKVLGPRRYAAVLEGSRDAIAAFHRFIEYGEVAMGELSRVHQTHHHESRAFTTVGVRVVPRSATQDQK